MERNISRTKWRVLFNELKERWLDLTQSDIQYINGHYHKLVRTVEIRRYISGPTRDVDEFLSTLHIASARV